MTLERIFIEWFLRFGSLLTIAGIGMAFLHKDAYVNLFIYSGVISVAIGFALMLISLAFGRQITGPKRFKH